jgi:hypothetical protein
MCNTHAGLITSSIQAYEHGHDAKANWLKIKAKLKLELQIISFTLALYLKGN